MDDDWQNFDVIAVASPAYAAELNRAGIKAVYVPQFTNPEKFYPAPDPALASDILFVGSNWHDRTSLRYALEAGFTVAVYGYNWQGIVPPEMYKAPYIANTELNRYYSSAKIVLNDHRPDMKDFGFVNNRIMTPPPPARWSFPTICPKLRPLTAMPCRCIKTRKSLPVCFGIT